MPLFVARATQSIQKPIEKSLTSSGPRVIPAERYHAAIARRVLSLLTVPTAAGFLYSVDTRLRPNGRAGLLVSSVEAFRRYQMTEAWTWELQALCRARAIAGDASAGAAFGTIRREALTVRRDPALLQKAVSDMRERIRADGPTIDYAPASAARVSQAA